MLSYQSVLFLKSSSVKLTILKQLSSSEEDKKTWAADRYQACVPDRARADSPGGRRKPDLLVRSLFVDDVGAMVPAYFDGQHTTLCMDKTENMNINPDLYMDTGADMSKW